MFFSSAREKFSPKISFCAEKISLTRSFCLEFARNSTFAGEEKEEEGVSSPNNRRSNIKTRKVLPQYKHKDEKTKGHHGKTKGQNQKANVLHGKDQAQASKRNCFSPPPPLRWKNTSRLSLKTSLLFVTSSLVSLKTSLPHTNSHSILRAGHAPTRIYAPALSANLPFLPSPFTLPRNKLYINRLRVNANPFFTFTFTAKSWKTTRCTTPIAKKRWRQKGEIFTRNSHLLNTLDPKGEEVKAKT